MGALRLETVVVGHIGDLVGYAIRTNVPVGSTNSNGLVLSPGVYQLSLLLSGNSIASFVSKQILKLMSTYLTGMFRNLRPIEAVNSDVVELVPQDGGVFVQPLWSANHYGDQSTEDDYLKAIKS